MDTVDAEPTPTRAAPPPDSRAAGREGEESELDRRPVFRYGDITPAKLAPLGFENLPQACYILREMAGHNVPDAAFEAVLAVVLDSLARSADPDRAVANLGRWADASGNRAMAYGLLAEQTHTADMLTTIFSCSQYFANLLIDNPEYIEIVTNPLIRDRRRGPDDLWEDMSRRIGVMKTANARRDALRRFKRPEILRIGVRDILGYAGLAETTLAISDFADCCLRMALQICAGEQGVDNPPFAIIAMGKLGGCEVNYSSDVDLIFVHADPSGAARGFQPLKLAEAVRDTMARVTESGFIFRVDLRLRPEGRFGPLSRSVSACRAYYESWAEDWERQAMLRARFVAGDTAVGNMFLEISEAFAYPSRVEMPFIEAIRENKRRIADRVLLAGEANVNVKEGRGGIRDIEFIVQLLQLIAGGRNPTLRTPNTLTALARLAESGLLTAGEAGSLTNSYLFLRDVEHRLQIMNELPVRTIPTSARELDRFARRLGYDGRGPFLQAYRTHTAGVEDLLQRLFFGRTPLEPDESQPAEWVTPEPSPAEDDGKVDPAPRLIDRILDNDEPAADPALAGELHSLGFSDPAAALAIVRHSFFGTEYGLIRPEARAAFVELADRLIAACAGTSDPDAALRGIDSLAVAVPSRFALYRSLLDSAGLVPRLAMLAADCPHLWQTLLQYQEMLDFLADDEAMSNPLAPPQPQPAGGAHVRASQAESLARWIRRARLRTGARDIWGEADVSVVMAELTQIAETALARGLAAVSAIEGFTGAFAVIGMGKLGGAELGYGSDYDVLYVAPPDRLTEATRLAERLQQYLKSDLAPYGVTFDVDARLRPDGQKGGMVLDIGSYRRYWQNDAALWERQALVKARFAAGDGALGAAFVEAACEFVYGSALTRDQADQIRAMKRRIERERAHGAHDLKLGPGGLSDIEWTCQLLQLRHGATHPRRRRPNTLAALGALRDDALITQDDWETLDTAYRSLTHARNHAALKSGVSADSLTPFPADLATAMEAARAVCRRVFYGE
ncbi:MAG: hypothetical protein ACLQVD_14890 [Capsulimonadaceae bacterium]